MSSSFNFEEGKRWKQTTMPFVRKRKTPSEDDDLPAGRSRVSRAQKVCQTSFHFDFSKDPRVIEEQKKIQNSKKVADMDTDNVEKPRFTHGATSDGKFFTYEGHNRFVRPKKVGSQSQEISPVPSFKMASGCPVVKEVRRVTVDESEENANDAKEKTRYLGSRPLGISNSQFRNPQTEKPTSSKTLLYNEITNGGGKKRVGWKAHESLKHFDDNIIDLIESEIMSKKQVTGWADVAGLDGAKKALKEIVILPFLRPEIFNGIRAPPKGVLLFGPPGTGKTMIGRCVASQCKATFFNIAASSLTSKWVGEGEKLVRVLFVVARLLQPSIIFIDEIDSLLNSRSESEHESSRRIKTEFLIHLDGVATTSEERLLVLGATNRPQELDDAAKRRFAKRLYIALPCKEARMQIVRSLLSDQSNCLSEMDIERIGDFTEGYSGADMRQLCAEASMCPVRDIIESSCLDIATVPLEQVRPIAVDDFVEAVKIVRPTVVEKDLIGYQEWDKQFGSLGNTGS